MKRAKNRIKNVSPEYCKEMVEYLMTVGYDDLMSIKIDEEIFVGEEK